MKIINIILFTILISSCAKSISYDNITVKNWEVKRGKNSFESTFTDFSGDTYQNFELAQGDKLHLNFETNLQEGTVEFHLKDDNNNNLWTSSTKNIGEDSDTLNIVIEETGVYKLITRGNKASGEFNYVFKK